MTIEYKIINTLAEGVPLREGVSYHEKIEAAFNSYGMEGWQFCGVISSVLIVFSRDRRFQVTESGQPEPGEGGR
jgi:hypothetical protein